MDGKWMPDVEAIAKQADAVGKWQAKLDEAKKHMASVRALNGQTGYSVVIGGRRIEVATMDSRTYMAKMIRGMEMIHLGALKALAGEIDLIERRLLDEQRKLQQLATQPIPPPNEE